MIMKKMTRLLAGFVIAAGLVMPLQADIPKTMDIDGNALVLNGEGLRKMMMMKIYKGALYLPEKSSDGPAIVAADKPMAIRLEMVSGLITSEKMEDATLEGLEKATDGNLEPIQDSVDAFINVFREEIKEGDTFDIANIPGKGIEVYKNGTLKKTIDGGLEFKQAVFAIWLGEDPVQGPLKKGMLGK